jgi:hypothetical protein
MIDTYTDLKAAVANWMARADVAGQAEEFIQLAEARLNRELNAIETDVTLTGTLGSLAIDVSAHSVESPIALFLVRDGDEYQLTPKAAGTFARVSVDGPPRFYSFDKNDETIEFERELDAAYTFRLRYEQYFGLSDAAPTNWLLTHHPDVYLAAVLVWGGLFIKDSPYAAQFQAVLNSGLPEVKSDIAQTKRGLLTVDAGLQRVQRPTVNNAGQWWP